MKKVTLVLALSIFLIYGCQKQESVPASNDKQVEDLSSSAWIYNPGGENPSWENIQISELQNNSETSALKQSNSAHTHGNYHAPASFYTMTFSGTQNNGGSHGSAEFLQEHPAFTFHLLMDTECVTLEGDGDEAIYVGIITQVISGPFPFDITGWYFTFKVKDNGQGNNAPADQYYDLLVFSPVSPCDRTFNWGGLNDVGEDSDKIKVND